MPGNNDSTIFIKSWAEGIQGKSRITDKKILLHQSIGSKITAITTPHNKFSVGGSMTLVDGVIGERPWKGDQWLGYSGDTILIHFNFEEKKKLTNFKNWFFRG